MGVKVKGGLGARSKTERRIRYSRNINSLGRPWFFHEMVNKNAMRAREVNQAFLFEDINYISLSCSHMRKALQLTL